MCRMTHLLPYSCLLCFEGRPVVGRAGTNVNLKISIEGLRLTAVDSGEVSSHSTSYPVLRGFKKSNVRKLSPLGSALGSRSRNSHSYAKRIIKNQ